MGLLASLSAPAGPRAAAALARLAVIVLVVHVLMMATAAAVAKGLRQMGLRPGDHVAVVGSGFNAYWARLARAKIVAEIPRDAVADFWAADDQRRARAIRALATTSASLVVLSPRVRPQTPDAAGMLATMGWQRVGAADYDALALRR